MPLGASVGNQTTGPGPCQRGKLCCLGDGDPSWLHDAVPPLRRPLPYFCLTMKPPLLSPQTTATTQPPQEAGSPSFPIPHVMQSAPPLRGSHQSTSLWSPARFQGLSYPAQSWARKEQATEQGHINLPAPAFLPHFPHITRKSDKPGLEWRLPYFYGQVTQAS